MSKIIKKVAKTGADEKKDALINELIEIVNKLGLTVRTEKGIFKGGFCLLREQKLFLINKNLEQDKKISILAKQISRMDAEGIYLKPSIRELIEKEDEKKLF